MELHLLLDLYLDQIDISDHNAIEQFVSREVRNCSLSVVIVDVQYFKCNSCTYGHCEAAHRSMQLHVFLMVRIELT